MIQVFSKEWFEKHQGKIKWFANTRWGRDILGLTDSVVQRVDKITPNAVFEYDGNQGRFDIRTHDKFAKRLYYHFLPVWKGMHSFDMHFANKFAPALNWGFDTFGPLYPQAGGGGGNVTCDGQVFRSSAAVSFAAIKAGAGTSASSIITNGTYPQVRASNAVDTFSILGQSNYSFDTSGIGVGNNVDAATLSIHSPSLLTGLGDVDIHIVESTQANNNNLATSDYQQFNTTSFGSINTTAWVTSAFNPFTLNAAGRSFIDVAGVTPFAEITAWDLNGVFTGTWSSLARTYASSTYADTTGTANDPKLEGTFTTGGVTRRIFTIS
jgi:hypothetical protein